MDSFEINKITSAIIIVVVLVVGIDKLSEVIFHVEKPKNPGYVVEVQKVSTSSDSTETTIDITALMAMGDVEHGKKVFKKCAACHSISKGGANKIGPALWGVIGRNAVAVSDYKYSKALSAHGKSWSFEEMNGFLIKPQSYIKGTKMAFAGLKKEKDRASVIPFMNQNSDNPLPLP